MLAMSNRFEYWPFPVRKPEAEWDEFDRDFLDFMRSAYAEGYRPRHEHCSAVEAENSSGRSAFLVFRGRRNGWEPFLTDGGQTVGLGPSYGLSDFRCVCVRPPFRAAGHLALEWLRGRSLVSLLSDFEFIGGRPEGIVWRPKNLDRSFVVPAGDD
jgi:hypothetical protein